MRLWTQSIFRQKINLCQTIFLITKEICLSVMINEFDSDLTCFQLYEQQNVIESFYTEKSHNDIDNLSKRWVHKSQPIQKKIRRRNKFSLQKMDVHAKNVKLFRGNPSSNNLELIELDIGMFPTSLKSFND